MDLNANFAECIKVANSIGGNTYYNVCKNTSVWVPWGSADWLLLIVGILAVLLFFGGMTWVAWPRKYS